MRDLLLVTAIVLAGFALFGISWWLERATRRPGLAFLICGVLLLVGAGLGLAGGYRLLPFFFGLQATGFFYTSRWRHLMTRAERADARPTRVSVVRRLARRWRGTRTTT
jgi:hypothetical protein